MNVNINVSSYLTESEIKEIVKEEVGFSIRRCIGGDKTVDFARQFARNLVKEELEKIVPDFKNLLEEKVKQQINTITTSDLFYQGYMFKTDGLKVLNSVLNENKELIDTKIKKLFTE